MEKQTELEQNQHPEQMSYGAKVALIGLFGGLIWSLIGYLAFYFKFIRVGPALILMPWALGDWKTTYIGQLVGIAVISLLSIGIAFFYRMLMQKIHIIWAGIGFGFVLWILVFYVINPFIPGLKAVQNLDLNTIITSLCLYVLYGLFIGYSISYEYAEQHRKSAS
ncbi:YqhR family membrane protein [Halalkalibacter urbisdiaboli]|uniref:YqhR family membrane protein n=1 Tax=Halalkalibacter urbisdiaboli TaxID=1960589 RepID=UPI000B437E8C|nr:YqhR family membrane protein [Halalkalibacter urbisdiaboli]